MAHILPRFLILIINSEGKKKIRKQNKTTTTTKQNNLTSKLSRQYRNLLRAVSSHQTTARPKSIRQNQPERSGPTANDCLLPACEEAWPGTCEDGHRTERAQCLASESAVQSTQERKMFVAYMRGLLRYPSFLLSRCVAQAGLVLMILLRQSPMCWNCSLSE